MERMICIAGFGDDSSMFSALTGASLSSLIEIVPIDLPGFGAPALTGKASTLDAMAEFVDEKCRECGARVVLAHSVASIIASLAALRDGSPIEIIHSLEGNLTAEDAYFSGTAARYDTPSAFHTAFMSRLAKMADQDEVIDRYRNVVEKADPEALWQLGKDAHQFSREHEPGDVLIRSASVTYLYNPDNLPAASLHWLENHDIHQLQLKNASHWASIDSPDLLAEAIRSALSGEGLID